MAKPVLSTSFDDNYRPHGYIKGAIGVTDNYCLPYGQVRIANPETGVIVALILYIIAKEPTVNHTKLECYIILLNRMVKDATDTELFTWHLNRGGRIGNFRHFFDYVEGKELIQQNGRSRFVILKGASNILPQLTMILRNLLPYLNRLLNRYGDYTAAAMLEEI